MLKIGSDKEKKRVSRNMQDTRKVQDHKKKKML